MIYYKKRSKEEIDFWNKKLEEIKNCPKIPSFNETMSLYNSELLENKEEIEEKKVSDFLASVESLWIDINKKVNYIIDKSQSYIWKYLWQEVYLIYNNWAIEENKASLSLKIWNIYYKIILNYKVSKNNDFSEENSFTLNVRKKDLIIESISKKVDKYYKKVSINELNWINWILLDILNNWRFNKYVVIDN